MDYAELLAENDKNLALIEKLKAQLKPANIQQFVRFAAIEDMSTKQINEVSTELHESKKAALAKLQSNDIPEGAKFKCLGEFTIEVKHACPNCYNESEEDHDPECEICGGEAEGTGYYYQSHQVPWTTQKDIWLAINECRNKE